MFEKRFEVQGSFKGERRVYEKPFDETRCFDVGPILWVPRVGWRGGRFFDGPVMWRGWPLLPQGWLGTMFCPAAGLPATPAPESICHDPDYVGSLAWSVYAAMGLQAEPDSRTLDLDVTCESFDLAAAVSWVILRKALPDASLYLHRPIQDPAWRLLLKNLNVWHNKGIKGRQGATRYPLANLLPELRPELVSHLVQKLNAHSAVIPHQLVKKAS